MIPNSPHNDPYFVLDEKGRVIKQVGTPLTFDDLPPIFQRLHTYNFHQQMNLLVDDIEAGVFGEAAKNGKFIEYIRSIKQQYPK